jgi:hypothetical protein
MSALTEVLWKAAKTTVIFSRAICTANAQIGSDLGFAVANWDMRLSYLAQMSRAVRFNVEYHTVQLLRECRAA